MSEINKNNYVEHIQNLYQHVKVLHDNHNQIIRSLHDMKDHISKLHKDLKELHKIVSKQ